MKRVCICRSMGVRDQWVPRQWARLWLVVGLRGGLGECVRGADELREGLEARHVWHVFCLCILFAQQVTIQYQDALAHRRAPLLCCP